MLQQFMGSVDFGVGQLIVLVLVLVRSWVGQLASFLSCPRVRLHIEWPCEGAGSESSERLDSTLNHSVISKVKWTNEFQLGDLQECG